MAHTLYVIDRESRPIGKIQARIGLRTWAGPICRMSPKSIWTRRADGSEWLFRGSDGPFPSVPNSYAR